MSKELIQNLINIAEMSYGIQLYVLDENNNLMFGSKSILEGLADRLILTPCIKNPKLLKSATEVKLTDEKSESNEGVFLCKLYKYADNKVSLGIDDTVLNIKMVTSKIAIDTVGLLNKQFIQDPIEKILWRVMTSDELNSVAVFLVNIMKCVSGLISDKPNSVDRYTSEVFDRVEKLRDMEEMLAQKLDTIMQEANKMHESRFIDSLTGLPNKERLTDIMVQISGKVQNIALYLIDVDDLRKFNHTLGYQVGNTILKAMTENLRLLIDPEVFIAKSTGDEFYVLLINYDSDEHVKRFADKILNLIRTVKLEGFTVTGSVGVVKFPENGNVVEDLLKKAEMACFAAKQGGKNGFAIFDSSMETNLTKNFLLEKDLRQAIINKELLLYYQPKVTTGDKRLAGFEALVRWTSPVRGFVSPGEFIPLAEKTNLILDIGNFVVEEACRQLRDWKDKGHRETNVGVNISVNQLQEKNFLNFVRGIVSDYRLSPQQLNIEITESAIMTNMTYCIEAIKELQNYGFTISLDDFGTGYSSLSLLRELPLNILKIDKSFVDDITSNMSLIPEIISMGHKLKLKIVAEGVERQNQVDLLTALGCDEIQGYFYSKPVGGDKAEELVIKHYF